MSVQDFSFLACLEVAEKFVVGWGSGGGGLGQFLGSALVKLNKNTIYLNRLSIKFHDNCFIRLREMDIFAMVIIRGQFLFFKLSILGLWVTIHILILPS